MLSGVVSADEIFQDQAKRLSSDPEDSCNQTIAVSPEWIASFRQQHDSQSDMLHEPDATDPECGIGLSYPRYKLCGTWALELYIQKFFIIIATYS